MALETDSAVVGRDWVLVGDGVTELYANEEITGTMWAYMTAPDGTAPTIDSPRVAFNGAFSYRGPDAQDIYFYSNNGETELGFFYGQ